MTDFDKKAREKNERELLEEMRKEKAKYQVKAYLEKKERENQPKTINFHTSHIKEDDLIVFGGSIYIKDKILSQTGITYYRLPLSIKEVNRFNVCDKG